MVIPLIPDIVFLTISSRTFPLAIQIAMIVVVPRQNRSRLTEIQSPCAIQIVIWENSFAILRRLNYHIRSCIHQILFIIYLTQVTVQDHSTWKEDAVT